ncbi:VCBS repeat protein [Krasilnikovia cinnamomea]|uniref:VCBS repeat protein n=1 Tax=Krasilnikovia cinnamomea TaxID=349313 RepID=A0A4Q7ZVD0_9ACTN|nr:glycoside hydrolase domain-containing protein [Krasilnikovia cinnamomea]RZU54613.1 VCBS repeat protein [Krasilnikovia cinnamomea]
MAAPCGDPGGRRPLFRLLCTAIAATVFGTVGAAPPAAAAPAPGTFTGYGFDTCTAPSSATMDAWLASPYRAIGIYFGGNNRACAQPNLTPGWVAHQQAAGWHLLPIYLGPQASCTTSNKRYRIDNTQAAAQGRAAADDAATQAAALGLSAPSVLIYDMEAYRTDDAACRAGVLAFMSAWTARLHDRGHLSGFYSSMASGVADQVANYRTAGYVRPDYLDFARWDGVATVTDPAIPASYWPPHRRMKQYRGDHQETYGGVTINIDNDYVDFGPLPSATFADFNRNGWSDVLARTTSSGNLVLYPGNGTYLDTAAARGLGGGWGAMNAIVRIGDLNRDGREDVVARQSSNGDLWFYPGTGSGFGTRKRIGTGWNSLREITAIGDFNRDGYPDLLAVRTADRNLYLYPGRAGTTLGPRVRVGTGGWTTMSELTGVGDFDRNGVPDLIARVTSTGTLQFYSGRSGGFAARRQIGSSWDTMRDLVGVGDFNRDGYLDLAAVQKSTNYVFLYPGNGSTLQARVRVATGFSGRAPLL